MSSFATASSGSSSPALDTLPRGLFESAIAPLLATADLLAFSSASRAARQLVLVPSLWRNKEFASFPEFVSPASSLPSWCDVVQLVVTSGVRVVLPGAPPSAELPLRSLLHFPNLRRLSTSYHVFDNDEASNPLAAPLTSLASLRHLTRISLHYHGSLDDWALKLLSSLPVLASIEVVRSRFVAGSEETLAEWLAVSSRKDSRKRKMEQDGDGDEVKETADTKAEIDEDEVDDEEDAGVDFDRRLNGGREDPNDPTVPRRHSPLLLFLHALASKPSFVHLMLYDGPVYPSVTPFVMDNMPMWPHLLCLSVISGSLRDYCIAPHHFPSLTSLGSSNCSNASIKQLVRLPKLEELCFPEYTMTKLRSGGVRTTSKGFRVFGSAASLRSVQYIPPQGHDMEPPSLAALTTLFTLTLLTRLTITALWLGEDECVPLLTQHRFEHLRCLELIEQDKLGNYLCPQSDTALLPLVKPAHMVVVGRVERQATRAVQRPETNVEGDLHADGAEVHDIPADNAANFPALECLALPYWRYKSDLARTGRVSAWMMRQLRRSYEHEVAAEWEAETRTLGEAELLKSIP